MISSLSGQDRQALTKPLEGHERRWDYAPTWSPDGSMVAFARWTPKRLSLMVVRSNGSGLRAIAGIGRPRRDRYAAEVYGISWAPDGSRLAYLWVFPKSHGRTEAISVAALDGSGSRRIALLPNGSFFSLFGWTTDGSRVTYAYSAGDGSRPEDYYGPSNLMTTLADGTGTTKVLTEYAIHQVSWLADGGLVYVRNCYLPIACQLELRETGSGTSRALTHFKAIRDVSVASETGHLSFMQLPSGDIVYTHGPKIYDFSPATNTTRTIGVVQIPRKKHEICDALSHWINLVRVSPDGRVALIEPVKWCNYDSSDPVGRVYRLDLATGAVTRMHVVTTYPEQIYLP